jgi:hypothetical protein
MAAGDALRDGVPSKDFVIAMTQMSCTDQVLSEVLYLLKMQYHTYFLGSKFVALVRLH